MGILDRFKKKDDNAHLVHTKLSHFKGAVLQSFSHLKQDLAIQKQWITYLSNIHRVLENAQNRHRELTKSELAELKRWINHLYSNARQHEQSMKSLERHLRHTIELYNKHIVELHKKINEAGGREKELRMEIMKDMEKLLDDKHRESHKALEKRMETHMDEVHEKLKPARPEPSSHGTLTNPEQKLLNMLMGESDPVSYSHIAEKTGNSVNTVRVIMNSLKKRGVIEEHNLPNGTKLFNAVNKERVKKLYNIGHL